MANAIQIVNALNFALDAIQQREQVIANNIANQSTPGYQASVVTFEGSLAKALANGGTASSAILPENLPSATNGNNVSLPAELALETQTNLENQAVANSINAQFTTLQTAITG